LAWDTESSWISPICTPAYAATIEVIRMRCMPVIESGLLLTTMSTMARCSPDMMGSVLAASAQGFFL
jgi:hypothetical protein